MKNSFTCYIFVLKLPLTNTPDRGKLSATVSLSTERALKLLHKLRFVGLTMPSLGKHPAFSMPK